MSELSFSSNALALLQAMDGFEPFLNDEFYAAMEYSLNLMEKEADSLMQSGFQNYTGYLAAFFYGEIVQDQYATEGYLVNPAPYAWRREEGFSGMTDSLGRFFPNDPGIHYMNDSLSHRQLDVMKRFAQAVEKALNSMRAAAQVGAMY